MFSPTAGRRPQEQPTGWRESHYQDLIREIIHNELQLTARGLPALLSDIEDHGVCKSEKAEEYEEKHPGSFERLKDKRKTIENFEKLFEQHLDPSMELKEKAEKYKKEQMDIRKMYQTGVVPLQILFEDDTDESLILRLKNMGVNPAGNSKDRIWDNEDDEGKSWTDLFDFSSKEKIWQEKISPPLSTRKKKGSLEKKSGKRCLVFCFRGFTSVLNPPAWVLSVSTWMMKK